jgi:hypothetical protein
MRSSGSAKTMPLDVKENPSLTDAQDAMASTRTLGRERSFCQSRNAPPSSPPAGCTRVNEAARDVAIAAERP